MNGRPGHGAAAAAGLPTNTIVCDTPTACTHHGRWTEPQHRQVRDEVDAAFNDGVRHGMQLAGQLVDQAVAAALARPEGHGSVDLDVAARQCAYALYQRYGLVPDAH